MNYAKALRCRARDAFEALRIAESDVADSQHNVMRLSGEAKQAELDVLAVKQAKAQEIGLQAAELLQQINDHNTRRALVDSAAAIGIASGTSR